MSLEEMQAHKSTLRFKTAWKLHMLVRHPTDLHKLLVCPLDSPNQTFCCRCHLASSFWYFWQRPVVLHLMKSVLKTWIRTAFDGLKHFSNLTSLNQQCNSTPDYGKADCCLGILHWLIQNTLQESWLCSTELLLCAKKETDTAHSRIWTGSSCTSNYCSKSPMKSLFWLGFLLQSCKVKSCYRN